MKHTDEQTDVSTITVQETATDDDIPGNQETSSAILLAEDNFINQKVVSAIVKKAGYRVTIVEDGEAAVEQYISAPDDYNLILMDIQMPKLDGVAATRAIRQWETDQVMKKDASEPEPRRVCIIAITAGAVYHEESDYFQAGMDDLLLKPVRSEVLLTMIDRWLGKYRQAGENAKAMP